MLRISRATWLTLTGLGFVGCTTLTSVDWSLIPPAAAGTSAGGDMPAGGAPTNEAGEPAGGQGTSVGGVPEAGGGGEAGYGGELGGAPDTAGTAGGGMGGGGNGGGGTGGGGSGGTSGGSDTGGGGSGGSGVVVCNQYPTTQPITNFTGKTVLYDGGAKPASNFGGRVGLDNICTAAAQTLGLQKKTIHALIIASSGGDSIATLAVDAANFSFTYNMPPEPIVSKFGVALGSWDNFAAAPATSLICAGVVPASVDLWFTGATQSGVYDQSGAYNCNNWTLGTYTLDTKAWVGRTDITAQAFHASWLSDRWVTCDNSAAHMLCLAWGD